MSWLTGIYLAAAAIIFYGIFYHGTVVIPARIMTCRTCKIETQLSPRWARSVYALMGAATAVLLWGYLHAAVVLHGGPLATIPGWAIALIWWAYIGTQMLRMSPSALADFRGWSAIQGQGAGAALTFLAWSWLIISAIAVLPFTV